ncbi:MAG TPA: PaaI family thioesterase, partial [Gammaproteobacteria bacterium]|nr:PaaI family thioesterase [Gammaproteobacteria bacterium]
MIWFKPYTVDELAVFWQQPGLTKLLGITITEVGVDYLCATMPVTADLLQIHGIMHGGATCALVETAGSFASRMCLDPAKQYSVGSYIAVNHLRPVKGGAVVARCKPVHIGRQKHVWDIPVYAVDTGKIIAKGEL